MQEVRVGFRFRRPTPVVRGMLVVLVAVWMISAIVVRFVPGGQDAYEALAFSPTLVLGGQHLWGLLTGTLLHSLADTDHLIFNGLAFYFFACDLEELWGRGRFILFMVLCALTGDAFVVAGALVGLTHADVVGFSGVVIGSVMAWGLSFPEREFFLRLRGVHLVYITLGLQILTALSFSRVSAAAHFGGMAAGAVFAMVQSGPLRRSWLKYKLGRLQAEAAALERGRRVGGPELRVIEGGRREPSQDKRTLN